MRSTDERTCQCGFDISLYPPKATVCLPCREAAAPVRDCPDCGKSFKQRYARKCETCARACDVYRMFASGQMLAQTAVAKAQNAGLLPHPSTCLCADCGKQAAVHEHRDYNKPLEVVQVCKSCNRKRGMAKRKDWTFDEFWAYFQTLPASKCRPYGVLTKEDFEPVRRKHFAELARSA